MQACVAAVTENGRWASSQASASSQQQQYTCRAFHIQMGMAHGDRHVVLAFLSQPSCGADGIGTSHINAKHCHFRHTKFHILVMQQSCNACVCCE